MGTSFCPALLALLLGAWGMQPSQWEATAQSGGVGAFVNGEEITYAEIEERARLLAASANVGTQARENFQRLIKTKDTEDRFRALQQEVINTNPGKTRHELIEIYQERQKEFGIALQSRPWRRPGRPLCGSSGRTLGRRSSQNA